MCKHVFVNTTLYYAPPGQPWGERPVSRREREKLIMARGPFGKTGSCAWWRAGPSFELKSEPAPNPKDFFARKPAKPENGAAAGQGPSEPGPAKAAALKDEDSRATPTVSEVVKVAAFDLDSTLVVTKSGGSFARGGHDWKWIKPGVPEFLTKQSKTHKIVVFSNQGAVVMGPAPTKSWTNLETKIGEICRAMPCDADVYAACKDKQSIYRKPGIGMWELYRQHLEAQGEEIDIENSFFVGDAAGRRGDHSNSDKEFADRLNLQFLTPEEWFDVVEVHVPVTPVPVPDEEDITGKADLLPDIGATTESEPPLKRRKQ